MKGHAVEPIGQRPCDDPWLAFHLTRTVMVRAFFAKLNTIVQPAAFPSILFRTPLHPTSFLDFLSIVRPRVTSECLSLLFLLRRLQKPQDLIRQRPLHRQAHAVRASVGQAFLARCVVPRLAPR